MPKKCQLLGKSFWLRRQKNTQKWVFGTFFGVEPWNVQPKGGPLVACFLMHFFLWIFAFLEQKFDYPPFLGSEGGSRGGPEGHPREGPPGGSPGGSGPPLGGVGPPLGGRTPPLSDPLWPPDPGGRTPPWGGPQAWNFRKMRFRSDFRSFSGRLPLKKPPFLGVQPRGDPWLTHFLCRFLCEKILFWSRNLEKLGFLGVLRGSRASIDPHPPGGSDPPLGGGRGVGPPPPGGGVLGGRTPPRGGRGPGLDPPWGVQGLFFWPPKRGLFWSKKPKIPLKTPQKGGVFRLIFWPISWPVRLLARPSPKNPGFLWSELQKWVFLGPFFTKWVLKPTPMGPLKGKWKGPKDLKMAIF